MTRTLRVDRQSLDWFRGWLEFAGGPRIRGIAYVPDWPRTFTIREVGWAPNSEHMVFEVASPEFTTGGEWLPWWHIESL